MHVNTHAFNSTFFQGLRTPNKTVLQVLWEYAHGSTISEMKKEINISKPTLLKIVHRIRNVVGDHQSAKYANEKMGGPGTVVQIDKSLIYGSRKANRGRLMTGNRIKRDPFKDHG